MRTTESPARRTAGYTLLVLFLINFLNFFDRVIPSIVLEPVRKEFMLSDTMLGVITTAFTLVYAVAGIPLGRLADKYRRTRILSTGVFIWSLTTAACGFAWNFVSFFLFRVGVGVGEASCAPAANSMIGDLYPAEKRGRALGIFMLGLPLGAVAAFAGAGQLAHHFGWRATFLFAAVPGLLVAALAWFLKEPARGAQERYSLDARAAVDQPFRRIIATPRVWWIILSGVVYNVAAYGMNTFLPALLIRYHGLNVAQAGGISAVVLGLTGLIGLTVGGWVADALHRRFARGRLLLGAVALLVAGPLIWFGLNQPIGRVVSLTGLLCAGWLLFFLYYVTVYASLQDVVEPRLRATAMAVYFFFQYVLGAAFGSTVAGMLSDHFAQQAMAAASAVTMSDAFRASGLQVSLSYLIPSAVFISGLSLLGAAFSFVRDAEKASIAPSAGSSWHMPRHTQQGVVSPGRPQHSDIPADTVKKD